MAKYSKLFLDIVAKFAKVLPKYEKMRVSHVVKNKRGEIRLYKGHPVVERTVFEKVFVGYEKKEFDFPIKNLHNDSVTSSILTDSDVESVRMIDDSIMDLQMLMVTQPEVSFLKTITRMNSMKASIVNSSKGRWGRAAELSKTQISKGESKTFNFSDINKFEEYEDRKKRKGILGMDIWIF
ncbi:hypothetical protein LCGC14_3154160 [marine sediment metagenome]|uniref:Uncharacterized protein n=1 Tax=marine sediment metagenome TaxID=412755 RepID=A0A0F8WH89_9ZZZZ